MIRKLSLLLGLLLALTMQAQESAGRQSLYQLFNRVRDYDYRLPQEKVYVLLDNNAYVEGETIWYKVWVVTASTLQPTKLSRVVYVELINDLGDIVARQTLRVVKGEAHGEFKLAAPILSGFYEIRAYTREMLNWGPDVCFSRVVPVYRSVDTPDRVPETVDRIRGPYDIPGEHAPRPWTFGQGGVRLSFYPEGGAMVNGLPGRVAFRMTDGAGRALDVPFRVCDAQGRTLLTARPQHEGRGMFFLYSAQSGCSAEVVVRADTFRFPLPVPEPSGRSLRVDALSDSAALHLYVRQSRSLGATWLGLCVTCRGQALYFDRLWMDSLRTHYVLPRRFLREGVNQLTLYDGEGNVVAERLVFQRGSRRRLRLRVQQNRASYESFSPVVMRLQLTDRYEWPVEGTLAVSVREAERDLPAAGSPSLGAVLLLASDLRGYVHRPEFYFEQDDSLHNEALDLLLLVQGWRRYDFRIMAGVVPFEHRHPIEDKGILLDGRVLARWHDKPLPGMRLNLSLYTLKGHTYTAKAKTDAEGKFAFQGSLLPEEWFGQLSVREGRKRKASRVLLNRWFMPDPRAFEPLELELPAVAVGQWRKPETFVWTEETAVRQPARKLPEVRVRRRKKRRSLLDWDVFNYKGGEQFTIHRAVTAFNFLDIVQQYLDRGEEVPEYRAWAMRAKFWAWGRKGVVFSLDNSHARLEPSGYASRNRVPEVYSQRFQSAVVTFRRAEHRFLADTTRHATAVVNFYSIPDDHPFYDRSGEVPKGYRRLYGHGFHSPAEFYAPDYAHELPPDPKDHRRTLYWNPEVKTGKDGRAELTFSANADAQQHLQVTVRGLTEQGTWVDEGN